MRSSRIWTMLLGLALIYDTRAGMAAHRESRTKRGGPALVVYVGEDNAPVPGLGLAKANATRIFGSIGIPVMFRAGAEPRSEKSGAVSIEMKLDARVPARVHPGAMAYALPFGDSGTRIHIFCDRVLSTAPETGPGTILGYVMVHEIAHVLQGSARHSEEGIMKAHWEDSDYRQMKSGTLPFHPTDVDLLRAGLDRRATRSARAE